MVSEQGLKSRLYYSRTLLSLTTISHPLATMVDKMNPTSSGTSKPGSSKTKKQADSFVPPSDASKSDILNPYFTHHSDHLGLVLISKPLNGDNYLAWRRAMTLALNAKNKLDFVNDIIKVPLEETHPDDYATWSRCNDMVHSWIVNTLNPEISLSNLLCNRS